MVPATSALLRFASSLGLLLALSARADNITCDVAVAGGGWSGVYFAYRTAFSSDAAWKNATVCLFEATSRIGGRTYSVPDAAGTPYTLDVGAYRFSPDMHLPGDLILGDLELPTECYEPACPPAYDEFVKPFQFNYTAPLRRIVDNDTRLPAGYATAIMAMVDKMRALPNVQVFTAAPVADLLVSPTASTSPASTSTASAARFLLADGRTVEATKVAFLNLPRNKLFALPSVPTSLPSRAKSILECVVFDMPPSLFDMVTDVTHTPSALSKAYLLYDDAWWATKLNETQGEFPLGDGFVPVNTSFGIWINVHW
jgi:hypothetical protein